MRYSVLLLFVLGCSMPKDGDVYKNKLTQERVKIDVGDCISLEGMQKRFNDIEDRVNEDVGGTRKASMIAGDYKPIKYNYETTSDKCVGYEEKGRLGNIGIVTYYVISDMEKFREQFSPIN